MASIGSEDGDIGFQIAPMVDVVFVLMLFFMANAGAQVSEQELGINLPGGPAAKVAGRTRPPTTPIMLDISGEGTVTMNGQPYGNPSDKRLGQLREKLKEMFSEYDAEDPVILRPRPETTHERIIDVLSAAAASGVKNLSFG